MSRFSSGIYAWIYGGVFFMIDKDEMYGPKQTIDPKTIDELPCNELFTPMEMREKREQIKKSVIKFNDRCWKAWCERNNIEF